MGWKGEHQKAHNFIVTMTSVDPSKKRLGSELHELYENETHLKKCRMFGKEIRKKISKMEFKRGFHLRERAFRAVHKNVPVTVQRLLGEGMDPDLASERGWTLLGIALSKGDACAEMVKLLLHHGAGSCNDMKGDPLFFVPAGNPMVQRLVVEASTDLNIRDFTGATPLICAAKNKDQFFYDSLLQNGADPSLRDDFGKTAVAYL